MYEYMTHTNIVIELKTNVDAHALKAYMNTTVLRWHKKNCYLKHNQNRHNIRHVKRNIVCEIIIFIYTLKMLLICIVDIHTLELYNTVLLRLCWYQISMYFL